MNPDYWAAAPTISTERFIIPEQEKAASKKTTEGTPRKNNTHESTVASSKRREDKSQDEAAFTESTTQATYDADLTVLLERMDPKKAEVVRKALKQS